MHRNTSDRSGPTVLIVDDYELTLKLLTDILQYQGYTVFTTRLGKTAFELARQHRPDLILMEIKLPDISGTEVARRLKENELTRPIPIIAVTAFAMSGDEEKRSCPRPWCRSGYPEQRWLLDQAATVGR